MKNLNKLIAALAFEICILISGGSVVFAQSEITVGDRIPDFTFQNVYYLGDRISLNIQDSGRLNILDFWGVNCPPCIYALPKLDSIQQEFGDEVQIVLVSSASQRWLDSIYQVRGKHNKAFHNIQQFISVTSDTVLRHLFPHKIIPHYVWIDRRGIVRAITGNNELTRKNIRQMIDDPDFRLPIKSEALSFNTDTALLAQIDKDRIQVLRNSLRYYSVLSEQLPNYVGSQHRLVDDKANNTVRITRSGSMLYLFADALFGFGSAAEPYKSSNFDYGKRVSIELKDSSRYSLSAIIEGKLPRFHYEAVLPWMSEEEVYNHYLSDLERFYGIRGREDKRKVRCFSLVRTTGEDKIAFQGDPRKVRSSRSFIDEAGNYRVVAVSLEIFRKALSSANKDKIHVFENETGYAGLVDLEIRSPLSNIPAVRKELREKYDMDILEREKEIVMMVLTEL